MVSSTSHATRDVKPSCGQVKTVLFICTANYYRSRFSEYLFDSLATSAGLPWRAFSRGLRTWMADGQGPIASCTVERLTSLGIDLDQPIRFPIPLTEADLRTADLVVAVKEDEHRAMIGEQFPEWADRVEYWHIDDIDCVPPCEALPACQLRVEALVKELEDGARSDAA